MYYTYLSTGNAQIDNEHANIDALLDLCHRQGGEWTPSATIVLTALGKHFESEEHICQQCGLNMVQEHLDEHRNLKKRLDDIALEIKSGQLGKDDFLHQLRDILINHITQFDKYLTTPEGD